MSQPDKDRLVEDPDGISAEQPWLKQAVTELRQPLAPSVAGQLRAARRTALAQETAAKPGYLARLGFTGLLSPGMALVAGLGAVAVAGMLMFGAQTPSTTPSLQANNSSDTVNSNKLNNSNQLLEDLPIIAAQDELQFYQDLELMQWLAQEGGLDVQG